MDARNSFNAVISFPRSGTDFFCSALAVDKRVKYFREYFNPLCNRRREEALSVSFGDERVTKYLKIMNEIEQAEFDRVMAATWLLDRHTTTKENFSATKFAQFACRFNIVVLTRKLYHTFPTSRPEFILPILNSFMLAGEYRTIALGPKLNMLRRYIASDIVVSSTHQAGILAYLVQHYILLFEAARHGTPILAYEDIMQGSGETLVRTLGCIESFGADPAKVARALEKARRKKGVDLASRRTRFFSECVAEWYAPVVEFIIELSPALEDSFRRYVFDPAEANL